MEQELLVAYLLFCIIKLAGYAGAAALIGRSYAPAGPRPSALGVGLLRTGIGMLSGLLAWGGSWLLGALTFYVAVLPLLRLGEWWLVLWRCYDRGLAAPRRGWAWAAAGTAWSYVLDLPALAGLAVFGRAWVC
jgi:hypothetical protein